MTFKEQLAADVGAVFLNPAEFGETHTVNDKEMAIVIDGYASSGRQGGAGQYLDGLYTKMRKVYVAARDFGPLPKQGSVFTVDEGEYTVVDAAMEGVMYVIMAEVSDSL